MFQVERQTGAGYWYEVMLSPFKTLQEVQEFLNKNYVYYDSENNRYRVIQLTFEN